MERPVRNPHFYDATVQRPGNRAETPQISDWERKRLDIYNTLENGVAGILEADSYKKWLQFGSKFHQYSWGNQMLIQAQKPDATQVAGYNRWKEMGRQVRKGEKGISIMVPHKRKITDEKTGEDIFTVSSFGVGFVFDIASTDGPPLPQPPLPKDLKGNDPLGDELFSRISDFVVDDLGVSHRRDFLHGHARGSWNPNTRTIALKKGLYADQEVKTFVHEAIHGYRNDNGSVDRQDAEMITESAAFVVLNHFGMDTQSYSFPYVAGYAQEKERFVKNLGEIQQVSHFMIDRLAHGAPTPTKRT